MFSFSASGVPPTTDEPDGPGVTFPDNSKGITAGIVSTQQITYSGSGSSSVVGSWTGLDPEIEILVTPQSANSRFLVLATFMGACEIAGFWVVLRDGTPIKVSTQGGSMINGHGDLKAPDRSLIMNQNVMLLDAPATTSEVSYSIGIRASNSSFPVYINTGFDVDGDPDELAGNCQLQVIEIGG